MGSGVRVRFDEPVLSLPPRLFSATMAGDGFGCAQSLAAGGQRRGWRGSPNVAFEHFAVPGFKSLGQDAISCGEGRKMPSEIRQERHGRRLRRGSFQPVEDFFERVELCATAAVDLYGPFHALV